MRKVYGLNVFESMVNIQIGKLWINVGVIGSLVIRFPVVSIWVGRPENSIKGDNLYEMANSICSFGNHCLRNCC
jgi:hypothetical protein